MSPLRPPVGPMSSFLDFALATGTAKVTALAAAKRNLSIAATDFYRPLREAVARAGRERRDAEEVFTMLMLHVGDDHARSIYPKVIDGYRRFAGAFGPLRWVEPLTAALPTGHEVSIAVNPEVGYRLATTEGTFPHHLKLYLRNEPLSQRRVDLTVALMAVALPLGRGARLGVLDLRNARVCYLSEKSASPAGWARLRTLVSAEAAAYGEAWARV